ncbi:MAG: M20/M25/M40 family metallo-hydrolase, partial [Actinobacteria bacterium]|nr:M20/M25/M40 family metallo-hydrolase [Actinomycetota bacterium]
MKTFVDLCSVNTFHGQEERAEAIVRPRLEACGVHFTKDAIGNLIGVWPGRGRDGRWIMLNAHTDTVRPTEGMTPRITSDGVASDGSSVLGADDKAGVAAIVEAVCALHASGASHGPVELVFTV